MAGNRAPLRIAIIAGSIILFACLLQDATGGPAQQQSSPKKVEIFYTWLEANRAPGEDSTALMAFRDSDTGGRPTLVWFQPQKRASEPGSFAVYGLLEKALRSQFPDNDQQDSVNKFRDAIRREEPEEHLPEGKQYHVCLHYVAEARPKRPILAADLSLFSTWNALVGPDRRGSLDGSRQPVILELTTKDVVSVKLAATQDLLLFKVNPDSFKNETEKLAARLEASAVELLAAMAKRENHPSSSVDLGLAEDDTNAPCARVVDELSSALSHPLASMEVRRSPARQLILEKLPSQLEVNFVGAKPQWVLANWGLQEARLGKIVFEGAKSETAIPVKSASIAGCGQKTLSLIGLVKTENGEKPLSPSAFSVSSPSRESEGGWSLRIRPPHGPQIGAPKLVLAGDAIRVEFTRVADGRRSPAALVANLAKFLVVVFPWLLVGGCMLLIFVPVMWLLRGNREPQRGGDADQLQPGNIRDAEGLIALFLEGVEGWWRKLNGRLSPPEKRQLDQNRQDTLQLVGILNRLIDLPEKLLEVSDLPPLGTEPLSGIWLREETRNLLAEPDLSGEGVRKLNRLLLEDLFLKFLRPDQPAVAEPIVTEPSTESGAEDAVGQGAKPQEQASPSEVDSSPELAELRRQTENLKKEQDQAKASERGQEKRYIEVAGESARLRRETSELKDKLAAQRNELKYKTDQIKAQRKDLEAKEKKVYDVQSEKKRLSSEVTKLTAALEKQKGENAKLQKSEKDHSDKVTAWQTALQRIGSNPEDIAKRWDRETGWLKTVTDALQVFFQAAVAKKATAAFKDRSPERLGDSLDTLGTEVREGRALVEEILHDLANEQGADHLVRQVPDRGAGELRLVYRKLQQQRAAIDRVRKLNPRIANVIWVIEGMRQLAESLARMATEPGARILTGTFLEPAPLATALQSIAEKSEERWNEMQRKVAGPERGSVIAVSRAFEDFLDWFLDGERLQTLTNVLRLAQVVRVYCAGASDPETEELYNSSIRYCDECVELQKRFEWMGVQLAPVSFFEPPQTQEGWLFHENGDSHPLIFESHALKRLAVNRALAVGEDLNRAVGDVSTWGFHCVHYKELRSDTRGWLCRGWRTL